MTSQKPLSICQQLALRARIMTRGNSILRISYIFVSGNEAGISRHTHHLFHFFTFFHYFQFILLIIRENWSKMKKYGYGSKIMGMGWNTSLAGKQTMCYPFLVLFVLFFLELFSIAILIPFLCCYPHLVQVHPSV